MKIRSGCVSNFSSSSFVIVGVKNVDGDVLVKLGWDKEKEDRYDFVDNLSENNLLDLDGLCFDDDFIGYIISYDSELENVDISIDELVDISNRISGKLNVPPKDVKLYIGTGYH